jgi:hypothetical protein
MQTGRNEASNMSLLLSKDVTGSYATLNNTYRKNIKLKIGNQNKTDTVYQGGKLKNCDSYLLPMVEQGVTDKLRA